MTTGAGIKPLIRPSATFSRREKEKRQRSGGLPLREMTG
jgi:hypothetical protein